MNDAPDIPSSDRSAQYALTEMLRDLTRAQVAYLRQEFSSTKQARAWLARALPGSLRPELERLHRELEQADHGDPSDSLELAHRVLDMQREMTAIDRALEAHAAAHADHALARPVVFVVTEGMTRAGPRSEAPSPLVVSMAGWNTAKPALLAAVDLLTIFSEVGGRRQVGGQVAFDTVRLGLAEQLRPLPSPAGAMIYATRPLPDACQLPFALARIPLGFIVGTSELL